MTATPTAPEGPGTTLATRIAAKAKDLNRTAERVQRRLDGTADGWRQAFSLLAELRRDTLLLADLCDAAPAIVRTPRRVVARRCDLTLPLPFMNDDEAAARGEASGGAD